VIYPIQSFLYTKQRIEGWINCWMKKTLIFRVFSFLSLFLGSLSILFLSSFVYFFSVSILVLISIIDYSDYIIPDILLLLLGAALLTVSTPNWIIGTLIFCIFVAVRFGYQWFKNRELIGWGDIKLLTIMACYLELEDLSLFFLLCSVGIVTMQLVVKKKQMAFGPILCICFLVLFRI
jgi:prepilin signal peptidase PulO-like enzyme (type II secretory pathway)